MSAVDQRALGVIGARGPLSAGALAKEIGLTRTIDILREQTRELGRRTAGRWAGLSTSDSVGGTAPAPVPRRKPGDRQKPVAGGTVLGAVRGFRRGLQRRDTYWVILIGFTMSAVTVSSRTAPPTITSTIVMPDSLV